MNNGTEESVQQEQKAAPKTAAQNVSVREKLPALLKKYGSFGWLFLLVLSIVLIGYYTLFPSRGYFHSDTTDTLMWAVASSESGTLFNPDFDYACLLPFSTSLIMWALIPVFGVTMTTHVLGMLCFFLLFTGGLIWMLRNMKWSVKWISLAVFLELMICSGSMKLREIFWGHTIYYSLGVLFLFVGLGLVFRQMDLFRQYDAQKIPGLRKNSSTRLIICTALIGIWFFLACTNQIIAITIFALPVMAAVFCERWMDTGVKPLCRKNCRALYLFGIMGIGMVLGYLLTQMLAKDIVTGYEDGYSVYSAMDTWVDNFHNFPAAWLSLLGVDVAGGDLLMSVKSVGNLLLVLTGIILLVMPVFALFCYRKFEDEKLRILTLTYWFMTLLIMMGYTMGKLSNANWRLSPIAAMSVVVTVAFLKWAAGRAELGRLVSLLMIPVVAVSVVTAVGILRMPPDNTDENIYYAIAENLEEKNLNYGYATFWNANVLTVVSDSAVECRAVNIGDYGYSPYNYQACDSWYEDQPGQDRYFLLMTNYEAETLRSIESPLLEKKTMEFNVRGYTVWVFNENIF